jgi:hypothetical protein
MEPSLFLNQTRYYFTTDSVKVTNNALSRCSESHVKLEGPLKLELREQKLQCTPAAKASAGPLGGAAAQAKQHPAHIKVPPHTPRRKDFGLWPWVSIAGWPCAAHKIYSKTPRHHR